MNNIDTIIFASCNIREDQSIIKPLIEEIISKGVDIIAVQGACHKLYDNLIREMNIVGYKYIRFDNNFKKYKGEILFTKLKIDKSSFDSFKNTREDRYLTRYNLILCRNDEENTKIPIWISTSELENTCAFRRMQLQEIDNIFALDKFVIFGGYTNIPSWQFDTPTPKGWRDAWIDRGKASNCYTFEKDRPDRFYYKGVECEEYDLLDNGGIIAKFKI